MMSIQDSFDDSLPDSIYQDAISDSQNAPGLQSSSRTLRRTRSRENRAPFPSRKRIALGRESSDFFRFLKSFQDTERFRKPPIPIKLYPWQEECLKMIDRKLYGNNNSDQEDVCTANFLYSAPTSGGKTLIAQCCMLYTVLRLDQKALIVLPYISIVNEKVEWLREFAENAQVRLLITPYFASEGLIPARRHPDIMVATFEKAIPLLNSMIDAGRIGELGIIVIDEVHMMGERRGIAIESYITKLIYLQQLKRNGKRNENEKFSRLNIMGMSATAPNLTEMASKWLRSPDNVYIEQSRRPIDLKKYVIWPNSATIKRLVYQQAEVDSNGSKVFPLRSFAFDEKTRSLPLPLSFLFLLVSDEIGKDRSVLVFCMSRDKCEEYAELISASVGITKKYSEGDVRANLKRLFSETDPALIEFFTSEGRLLWLQSRVFFHHANLSQDQRKGVERLYHDRIILCLFCTTTLAAGVNLPAATVIVHEPSLNSGSHMIMDGGQLMQIMGRAGRAGMGTATGDATAYVLVKNEEKEKEKEKAIQLIRSGPKNVESSINERKVESAVQLSKIIIDSIVGKLPKEKTTDEIVEFLKCTFWASFGQRDNEALKKIVEQQLQFLRNKKLLLEAPTENDEHIATPLGIAVSGSSLSIEEGEAIDDDLKRARRSLVLLDDLHLCFFSTPLPRDEEVAKEFKFVEFLKMIGKLLTEHSNLKDVLTAIFQKHMTSSKIDPLDLFDPKKTIQLSGARKTNIRRDCLRFLRAAMLHDAIREDSVADIVSKFNEIGKPFNFEVSEGQIELLMERASTWAYSVSRFCNAFGYWHLEALFSKFSKLAFNGAMEEIIPLLRLKNVRASRARALWKNNYRSLEDIASASKFDLGEIEETRRNGERWISVSLGTERADAIIQSAKECLLKDYEEQKADLKAIRVIDSTQQIQIQ